MPYEKPFARAASHDVGYQKGSLDTYGIWRAMSGMKRGRRTEIQGSTMAIRSKFQRFRQD